MICKQSQIFAKEIFSLIAMYVNDPLTFRNLGLVCKRSYFACSKLTAQKKCEFAKKIIIKKMRLTTIYYCLPNKWKHGDYTQWYNNGIPRKKGSYENGHMTGYWEWKHYAGNIYMCGTFNESRKYGMWTHLDTNGHAKYINYY